jgi:hypothetical protein
LPLQPRPEPLQTVDLSSDWKITFAPAGKTVEMPRLRSWTAAEDTRFYSGEAVYGKTISLAPELFRRGAKWILDFGPGSPIEPPSGAQLGMEALLEGPVREAAIVFVDGKRAGSIWHPPYQLDVTAHLHPGANHFEIRVANLAINEMAGEAQPDYRLLNLRYGERFRPQDMNNLRPLPSGIVGPIHLIAY